MKNKQARSSSSNSHKPPLLFFNYEDAVFEGQLHANQKQGLGIVLFFNGCYLIGNFQQDKLNGKAVIFTFFGSIIYCFYQQGVASGPAVVKDKDKFLCGRLKNGQFIGQTLKYVVSESKWKKLNRFSSEDQIVKSGPIQDFPLGLRKSLTGTLLRQLLSGHFFLKQRNGVQLQLCRTQQKNGYRYGFQYRNKSIGTSIYQGQDLTLVNSKQGGYFWLNHLLQSQIMLGKGTQDRVSGWSIIFRKQVGKWLIMHDQEQKQVINRISLKELESILQKNGQNSTKKSGVVLPLHLIVDLWEQFQSSIQAIQQIGDSQVNWKASRIKLREIYDSLDNQQPLQRFNKQVPYEIKFKREGLLAQQVVDQSKHENIQGKLRELIRLTNKRLNLS